MNVGISALALELQNVGPNPDLDGQPLPTGGLAKILMTGDFNARAFSIQLYRRVRVALDRTLFLMGKHSPIRALVPVVAAVNCIRPPVLFETPVCHRFFFQHRLFIVRSGRRMQRCRPIQSGHCNRPAADQEPPSSPSLVFHLCPFFQPFDRSGFSDRQATTLLR